MRNNDNIIFVDYKGVSHNARVQSFREHRNAQDTLVHDEPLVTLNYNAPPNGEPLTLIDVPHISHPSRKDNNPDLPSYPLHAWKREDEEHLELPEDHPVHDHFNEQPQRDDEGNIVPKQRPQYEAHIAQHRAVRRADKASDPNAGNLPGGGTVFQTEFTTAGVLTPKSIPVMGADGGDLPARTTPVQYLKVGHPAHPETVSFPFTCESCGASVTRIATHHGGKQWIGVAGANLTPPTTGVIWQEHVCSQSDIDAFRKKIEDGKKPKEVELSPSERLAAGEKLAPEAKKPEAEEDIEIVEPSASERMSPDAYFLRPVETDVIAELEKAPPAPSETENKPEDAA